MPNLFISGRRIAIAWLLLALLSQTVINSIVNIAPFEKVLFVMLFLFSSTLLLFKQRMKTYDFYLSALISCFIGIISSINYPERLHLALLQSLFTYSFFLYLFMFNMIRMKNKDINFVILTVLYFSAFTAFIGVLEFSFPSIIGPALRLLQNENVTLALSRGEWNGITSVFWHPGSFAWFCGVGFVISLSLYIKQKKKLYAFFSILIFIALILTLRRKTIIAVICTSVVIFWVSSKKPTQFFKKLLLPVILISVVISINVEKFEFLISDTFERYLVNSNEYGGPRVQLTRTSFEIANNNFPLGAGLGNFGSYISSEYYSPVYTEYGINGLFGLSEDDGNYLTDTFWPMLIGEVGYLGTMLYFISIVLVGRCVFNHRHRLEPADGVYLIALGLFFMTFIESISTPTFSNLLNNIYLAFFVSILINSARDNKIENTES